LYYNGVSQASGIWQQEAASSNIATGIASAKTISLGKCKLARKGSLLYRGHLFSKMFFAYVLFHFTTGMGKESCFVVIKKVLEESKIHETCPLLPPREHLVG
jgi:hypothetical protein